VFLRVLAVVTVVAASGVVASAAPAAATGVSVGSGAAPVFVCHATATVTPSVIYAGPIYIQGIRTVGWVGSGAVSGDGTCQSDPSAPWQLTFSGTWNRSGSRDASTGECPPAGFELQMHLTNASASFDRTQSWLEMTDEMSSGPSRQVIAVDPIYTPFPLAPVPVGTDGLYPSFPVGTSYGIAQTDPAACAVWPASGPPPDSLPAPPPFQVTADWSFPGPPLGPGPTPTGLLQFCLTVQGVVPRSCLNV
jgi:hypothetical protein